MTPSRAICGDQSALVLSRALPTSQHALWEALGPRRAVTRVRSVGRRRRPQAPREPRRPASCGTGSPPPARSGGRSLRSACGWLAAWEANEGRLPAVRPGRRATCPAGAGPRRPPSSSQNRGWVFAPQLAAVIVCLFVSNVQAPLRAAQAAAASELIPPPRGPPAAPPAWAGRAHLPGSRFVCSCPRAEPHVGRGAHVSGEAEPQ